MQKRLIFTALEYRMAVLGVLFQCPKVSPFIRYIREWPHSYALPSSCDSVSSCWCIKPFTLQR